MTASAQEKEFIFSYQARTPASAACLAARMASSASLAASTGSLQASRQSRTPPTRPADRTRDEKLSTVKSPA
jgi:hypothetical protein